jgi:hypothetical protein
MRLPAPLRRLLTNPPAVLGICIAFNVVLAVARAHVTPAAPLPVLVQFASTIDGQYHECVPLGWFPDSRSWRAYFPGYSADVVDRGVMFESLWVGIIPEHKLNDPHVAAVKSLLDELARLGMLTRHEIPAAVRYNLTREGALYYYERSDLGNNSEQWPYLCFSRLHARDVAWTSRPSAHGGGRYADVTARVRFSWEPSEDAPWATPFVKAHAVELSPTKSPAEATALRFYDGRWGLRNVDFAFPLVENPGAWTNAG